MDSVGLEPPHGFVYVSDMDALAICLALAGTDPTPETQRLFVTKVQPILANHCGKCHRGERDTFRLLPVRPGHPDAERIRDNQNMALKFVRPDAPENSPLLTRAVKAHGGAPFPPIKDRSAAAYQTLERWVLAVAAVQPGERAAPGKPEPRPASPSATDPYDPAAFNKGTQ